MKFATLLTPSTIYMSRTPVFFLFFFVCFFFVVFFLLLFFSLFFFFFFFFFVFFSYMAFAMTSFVPHLSFLLCLGRPVLVVVAYPEYVHLYF